jgi:GT2 family glycosyltransferase
MRTGSGYARGYDERVSIDGKQFAIGSRRFRFRGVTYGTFAAREDGELFPEREAVSRDLTSIAEAGFTVVRTYTTPPDDVLELAADHDLRLLSDVFYADWRYIVGASRRQLRRIAWDARDAVRRQARRVAGNEHVLALSLGNEIPADAVRWVGTRRIAQLIAELADIVHEEDPDRLVTYANYPTTEYLPLDALDFITFNVFLEDEHDFRRYITHLQHLAGDRPLVLGEIGLNAGTDREGEHRQAESLDRQLAIAAERGVAGTCIFSWTDEWAVGAATVEGWHFGLTNADRSPKPAVRTAQTWNNRDIRDLRTRWPSMSVVVCAHNAAPTLDECLRHTSALDYPGLEVIVVDDGSTDDTTAIASRYPDVDLIRIPHSGLSAARNEGLRSAQGEIVAYLDADAFPTPEWPYLIALGFDGRRVGGVGGPNVPPIDDPPGAQVVARSPGGPVHVLVSDDRAEHIPGCNMAFWKSVLVEVGGFDPVYTSAGDDVDVCWKIIDRGWEIGFAPAALVWHRRRAGLRAYLRQQRGYGEAEALVEARHPNRFGPLGTASWRGRIYNELIPAPGRQRIYRGAFGLAPFQSIYRGGGHALDVAHQAGLPAAIAAIAAAPLAAIHPALGLPSVAAVIAVAVLVAVDMSRVKPPKGTPSLRFRGAVAVHHLLQPIVRMWGRWTNGHVAARDLSTKPFPAPIERVGASVLLLKADAGRAELVGTAVRILRRGGIRTRLASEWEDHDARLASSTLVTGALITSAHLPGVVQLRIRTRPSVRRIAVIALVALGASFVALPIAAAVATLAAADVLRGLWRTGYRALRILERGTRTL